MAFILTGIRMTKIEVFGKDCGEVVGNVLMTVRNSRKHLFHRYNGYGLSLETIKKAKQLGAVRVEIEVPNNNELLVANLDDFLNKGKDWTDLDGLDPQKILPLKEFKISRLNG